jgi:hypothetical protein
MRAAKKRQAQQALGLKGDKEGGYRPGRDSPFAQCVKPTPNEWSKARKEVESEERRESWQLEDASVVVSGEFVISRGSTSSFLPTKRPVQRRKKPLSNVGRPDKVCVSPAADTHLVILDGSTCPYVAGPQTERFISR